MHLISTIHTIRPRLILSFSAHTNVPPEKALTEDSEANSTNSRNEIQFKLKYQPGCL